MLLSNSIPLQRAQLPPQSRSRAALGNVIRHCFCELLQAPAKGADGLSLDLRQAWVSLRCCLLVFRCFLEQLDRTGNQRPAILLQHLDAASRRLCGQAAGVSGVDAADEGIDETFKSLFPQVPCHKFLHGLFPVGRRILDADGPEPRPDLPRPRQEIAQDGVHRGRRQCAQTALPPDKAIGARVCQEDVVLQAHIARRGQDGIAWLERIRTLLPESAIALHRRDVATDTVSGLRHHDAGTRSLALELQRCAEARDTATDDDHVVDLLPGRPVAAIPPSDHAHSAGGAVWAGRHQPTTGSLARGSGRGRSECDCSD
mmetsp:Transcript_2946/g.8791  ORF Transcript_2946/g.8791 Transcript_2946/m.8791 type:complete len:315 (+) Transcript_2946:762-1706(+)